MLLRLIAIYYSLMGWELFIVKGHIFFPDDINPIPDMKPVPAPRARNLHNCKTIDNKHGICTQLQNCPTIYDNSNPEMCPNSIGYLVYICCPNDIAASTIQFRRRKFTTRAARGPIASSGSLVVNRYECAAVSNPLRNSFGSNSPNLPRQLHHTHIVGGTNAQEGSWPWMAAIYKISNDQKFFECGGSIVGSEWILSAAHCFPDRNERFVIRVGVTDLMHDNPVDTPSSKIFVHPAYAPPVLYNDIALVKLSYSLRFSEVVKPICLPSGGAVMNQFVDEDVRLAGWGSTKFGGKPTNALQEVVLPVIKLDKCEEVYRKFHALDISFPNGLIDGILCAGNKGAAKDACQGDSGGPLVKSSSDGIWEVIGVVSTGIGCGKIDVPGVYTRVGHYMDWLLKTIENN